MNLKFPYSRSFMVRSLSALLGVTMLASGTLTLTANAQGTTSEVVSQAAVQAWQANKAFVAGDIVSYSGKLYKAKWWSFNSRPDLNADSSWELLSSEDTTPPTAPTNLVSTSQTASSITLSWIASTDNVGVIGYDIYRNDIKVGFTVSKLFTDYELQPDTSYQYVVKALDAAGNQTNSSSISVKTITGAPELSVGESRLLTDSQIISLWNGIDSQYSPDKAEAAINAALPKAQYEDLFPLRAGTPEWHAIAKGKYYYKEGLTDYYSYDNLIAAVREVANVKYKDVYREGDVFAKQIYRLDKASKKETLVYQSADFKAPKNVNKPLINRIVDFGTFVKEGAENNRKRELAAFLANIAHETGGGWATAPGGELRWALFFNEELNYVNGTGGIGYVDQDHPDYPPVPGKSYHGRGPIQLSWNYNYGLIGAIIYGDQNVLLQNPDVVAQDGKIGFMTALLFWMIPQDPKPSNHDIMVGNYVPTAEQLAKGLVPGFGATIMVINGGQEGNLDESDVRIKRRVGHYLDLTTRSGANIEGEKLNTLGMQPF
ncbi:chitinase [Paenibacillus sp. ACRRX]|uniref:glycoside hydrolase family 19 protein n=1 Tax=unclassified Paenibacillus TaxID=185978 RepID=UPI001EF41E4A|nr:MULTISPECIES: glycoside hydrolase family 19 protein [unclassified Paenibacillus]MCG7407530.1 chitinase [Paenibacillus sp. ACRRX]MDK8180765.1 glycoside hydrolase family 19 protein [Paenibacillus sp. UMB4589-SE434]